MDLRSLGLYNKTHDILEKISNHSVLFVNPYKSRPDHDALLLGIASILKQEGRSLSYLKLNESLTDITRKNFLRRLQILWQEQNQKNHARKLFSDLQLHVHEARLEKKRFKSDSLTNPRNFNDLDEYFRLNRSKIYSDGLFSEVHDYINPKDQLSEEWRTRIQKIEQSAESFHDYLINYMNNLSKDTVIITVNGRWALTSVVIKLARANGFTTVICETGSRMNRIQLYENSLHSSSEWRDNIQFDWSISEIGSISKINTAKKWVMDNRSAGQNPYVSAQTRGLVLKKTKKNRLVFFATSGSETSPFEDVLPSNYFQNQYEAVRSLFSLSQFSDWEKIVRSHPQLQNAKVAGAREDEQWKSLLKETDGLLIESMSKVDSYELARSSNLVAGFYTNMLAETIWMEIPTIILGDATFCGLVPDLFFPSQEKLSKLNLEEVHSDKERIMPYFYHQAIRGIDNPFLNTASPVRRNKVEKSISRLLRNFNFNPRIDNL